MSYCWKHDIDDVTDDEDVKRLGWDLEDVDNAFYLAGKTIAEYDGEGDPLEKAADIIGLYYVSDGSKLSGYLDMWHELHGRDVWDAVRDYTDYKRGFLFVTGTNYDVFSRDLLGGYHDSVRPTKGVFDEFVEAMEAAGIARGPRCMDLPLGNRERRVIDRLRGVECLQTVRDGKAVVEFEGDDGSGFSAAYDPEARSWSICG